MQRMARKTLLLLLPLIVGGCQTAGANLQPNVYQAGQVNQEQQAKVVKILAIMPAKVEVDNSAAKKNAQIIGGLLGAIGGGVLGNHLSHNNAGGTAIGALGGGGAGAAAGSLVDDKVLVDGVSITYEDHGNTLNSAQVGKLCEYKQGSAVVISTGPGVTRIQPNATCPETEKDQEQKG